MYRFFMTLAISAGISLTASQAMAHSALLNCFDNADGTFTCQGGYSDGSSATGIRIVVMDKSGTMLQEAQLNADSEVVLPYPNGDFRVLFDGGSGHSVEITGDVIMR
ncbi:MAG: hypothetical protein R3Y11_01045 [Pseudomonadota bacterium]